MTGPLWIGPLQEPEVLGQLLTIAESQPMSLSSAGCRLLQRLQGDCGLPVCCWSTAELASRLRLVGPPAVEALVQSLVNAGHRACSSAVMNGQLRSDAPMAELLQQCMDLVVGDR